MKKANNGHLEPGCLAMVYGDKSDPNNNGKIVTCLSKTLSNITSPIGFHPYSEIWEIDKSIAWVNVVTNAVDYMPYCPAEHLMRIDNGDFKDEDIDTDINITKPELVEITIDRSN